jgi:hypothetical protein
MSESLADQLQRLCCAETEGKFFDCVTENIDTIIAALRCSQGANSEQRQADVRQDGFAICRAIVEDVCVLSAPPAPDSTYERAMHEVGTTIVAKIDALASQAPSEASGDIPCEPFRLESDVDEDGFMTNTRIVPAPSEASSGVGPVAWDDAAEDDPQVVLVAHAIAEHGIGRPWNDFLPTNAYDVDHGDLIEYARAAVAAYRASPPPSASQASCSPPESVSEDDLAAEIYAGEYDRDEYPFAKQSSAEQLTYRHQAKAVLRAFSVTRRTVALSREGQR